MPDRDHQSHEAPDPNPDTLPDMDRPRTIESSDLFQGRREVWIEHGDEMYRLRITSRNRLYLSK